MESPPQVGAGSTRASPTWGQTGTFSCTLSSLGCAKTSAVPFGFELAFRLLQGRAAARASDASRAGKVVLDDAGLAGAELTLTRGAHRGRRSRGGVRVIQSIAALNRGIGERIAALGASCQDVVNDAFPACAKGSGI